MYEADDRTIQEIQFENTQLKERLGAIVDINSQMRDQMDRDKEEIFSRFKESQGLPLSPSRFQGARPKEPVESSPIIDSGSPLGGSSRTPGKYRYGGKLRKFENFTLSHAHPEEWIDEVGTYVHSFFEDDRDRVIFIKGLLERQARNELKVRLDIDSETAQTILMKMKVVFCKTTRSPAELQMTFCQRVQQSGESLQDYTTALVDLMVKLRLHSRLTYEDTDLMLKNQLETGVRSLELKRELRRINEEQPQLAFSDMKNKLELWAEKGETKQKKTSSCQKVSPDAVFEENAEAKAQYAFKSRVDDMEKMMKTQKELIEKMADQLKQLVTQNQPSKKTADYGTEPNQCSYCGKKGHFAKFCFSRKRAEREAKAAGSSAANSVKTSEGLKEKGLQ